MQGSLSWDEIVHTAKVLCSFRNKYADVLQIKIMAVLSENSHQHLNNVQQIFLKADAGLWPTNEQFCHDHQWQNNTHAGQTLHPKLDRYGLYSKQHRTM